MGDPNRDQVAGRTDKAAGEIKETVGQATHDEALEREGAREKAEGEAQQDRGDSKSEIVDQVTEQVTKSQEDKLREGMKS